MVAGRLSGQGARGGATPAASDARDTPAASDARATPAASDAHATPAASDARDTPAASDAHDTPAASDARAASEAPPSCVLAIECATRVLSLALQQGAHIREWTGDGKAAHAEQLLPALQRLLESSECSLDEVELIALSIGPGSFTGLRTALSCVKGLAFSGRPPVAAVSTLAGLAAGAEASGPVAVLLGAGRGEVYAGAFARPGAARAEWLAESVYRPEALAEALPRGVQLALGEGGKPAARELCALRPDLGAPLPPPSGVARAAALLGIAAECAARGEARHARELAPRYLRRAEAEARRTGQALEAPD